MGEGCEQVEFSRTCGKNTRSTGWLRILGAMDSPVRGRAPLISMARSAAPFLPAAGVLTVWAALMPADGGYFARDWLPAGIIFTGLWLLGVIGGGRLVPPGRELRIALGTLAALVAFAFLSTVWAESPTTAWATASQFLTVALSVWTLALAPWRAGVAQLFFGLFGLAAALAFAGSLLSALSAEDLTDRFIDGRFAQPIGYPNGLGNFGFFAALPVLALSASPARHWALRGAAIGLATFLVGYSLLPQSRGAVLALIVAAAVLVALSRRRWRMVARLGVVGGVLAIFSGPIFDLFDVASAGAGVGEALDDAARAILLATLAAAVGGAALALGEDRLRVSTRLATVSGVAALGLVALAGIGAAAIHADRIDRLIDRQREAWNNPGDTGFEAAEDPAGSSRLLSSDPLQRYQYWHVSLDAFTDHPVAGLGAGGFERRYTEVRSEGKYSSFPHSLLMRVLAEGGILGLLGALAFIVAVMAGTLRRLGEATADERAVVAGALAAAVCFVLHAQLDWLEEFPALAGPALAWLVVAMAIRRGEPPRMPSLPWTDVTAAGVLAVVALLVLVPPYAALRYRERATAIWRIDAPKAYRDLARAAALDPMSDQAHLIEGTIALQRRELSRARAAFEAAVEREDAWLAHFELALVLAAQGDRKAATRQLDAAEARNPQEAAIAAARTAIGSGGAVDPVRLNRRLFESPLFNAKRLT